MHMLLSLYRHTTTITSLIPTGWGWLREFCLSNSYLCCLCIQLFFFGGGGGGVHLKVNVDLDFWMPYFVSSNSHSVVLDFCLLRFIEQPPLSLQVDLEYFSFLKIPAFVACCFGSGIITCCFFFNLHCKC